VKRDPLLAAWLMIVLVAALWPVIANLLTRATG